MMQPAHRKDADVRRRYERALLFACVLALPALGATAAISSNARQTRKSHAGPLHRHVTTTFFWVGEPADSDNGDIANAASAWDDSWEQHFGGVDDPEHRSGYRPAAFVPKENAFYVALPYNDYDGNGDKKPDAAKRCPHGCKNRWVRIIHKGRAAYAQWEDVGPFGENDVRYVFGTRRPKSRTNEHAGFDVSPAVRDYFRLHDIDTTSWQFVPASAVPHGPWRKTVTTRGVSWK
jgi:hypothetical protein